MSKVMRAIKTFIKDPPPTGLYADVCPGLNVLDGIVKVDEPMRSPVRGQNCVAFFYRGVLVVTGARSPAPVIHKIREASVYAPFRLDMQGGEIDVIPSKPGGFTREEHQRLSREYGSNFQGVEEVIMPGARVRVWGKVREVGGRFELRMRKIHVIDKQAVSAGVVGDRKKRRKRG